jgi:hypothetical protein
MNSPPPVRLDRDHKYREVQAPVDKYVEKVVTEHTHMYVHTDKLTKNTHIAS